MQISKAHCVSFCCERMKVLSNSVVENRPVFPCALLNEPLEAHNVAALKWWLLSWHKGFIVLQKATSYATPATQWPWWAQVSKVGFHVNRSHPFLGTSPDCGSSCGQLYALVEVKWPYSYRNKFSTWSHEIMGEFELLLPSAESDGNRRKALVWLCCIYAKGNQHRANHIWSWVLG